MLTVDVTKVTILNGRGTDKVSFHTTEVSPFPGITDEPLCLDFMVEAGDGYRYVTEVLRIDEELIEQISI